MESNTKTINKKKNILIGISGSVACIKLKELVDRLTQSLNVNVCIVPTQNSLHFIQDFHVFNKMLPELNDRLNFLKESNNNENVVLSFIDKDEWSSWNKRSDPVLHIELKKWAHIFLLAPLDANTLAKLANGLCDNLLTSIARAWDVDDIKNKPIVICPSMNTYMFKHPITNKQIRVLTEEFGYTMIDCVEKLLMCGDVGIGGMASVDTICIKIQNLSMEKE